MNFARMMQGCKPRDPSREGTGCIRGNSCKPIDWQRAFAFASGGGPDPRSRQADEAIALPGFLGVLAEALRRYEPSRPRPAARETSAKSVSRDVERILEPLLPTGDIGMDRVARQLGIGRQTLSRRLKAEGTNFERVLDGLRRRMARRFIDRDGLGVKQTAYLLGFSEPAAFSRAFKRWTGRSPGARP